MGYFRSSPVSFSVLYSDDANVWQRSTTQPQSLKADGTCLKILRVDLHHGGGVRGGQDKGRVRTARDAPEERVDERHEDRGSPRESVQARR